MPFMLKLIFPFEAEITFNFSHMEDKKFVIIFSSLATRFTFVGLTLRIIVGWVEYCPSNIPIYPEPENVTLFKNKALQMYLC